MRTDSLIAAGLGAMGAGFALFVEARDAQRCVEVSRACGIDAWVCGHVEPGRKSVLIEPLGLRFEGESLQLR